MSDRFSLKNQILRTLILESVHAQWSKCAKKRSKVRIVTKSYPTSYKKLHEQNQHYSPWLKSIEQILNTSGYGNVWQNPDAVEHNWLKKTIERRLSDIYIQNWQQQVNTMSSCIIYRSIKPYFKSEKYLMLSNISDRISICKFRCRNTKIPVVILGYANSNTAYENRLCSICDMNEVGDEYHYILKCPAFQDHRNQYLSEFYTTNPNMDKFAQLFQSSNNTVLCKLAKFTYEINRRFR